MAAPLKASGRQLGVAGCNLHCIIQPCPRPGGRYLNDTWALNLENLTWKAFVSGGKSSAALPASSAPAGGAPPPPAPLTPIAGHVVVPWHGSLVLVGGHMKVRGAGRLERQLGTPKEPHVGGCCRGVVGV